MPKQIRIGHSPDADDAFMFYALSKGYVTVDGCEIVHMLEDIQSLNRRAARGDLEVSAISVAAYPSLAERYRIMIPGAAIGEGYGPIVVSKTAATPEDLRGKRIAIPGPQTTAFMLLRLYLDDFEPVEVPFDHIPQTVQAGQVDAGLVIHETQITYEQMGFTKVIDLGDRWQQDTDLPVPLGLDVVRRDLGEELCRKLSVALRDSIAYAFEHEEDALTYALEFSRGLERETCRRFVRMYVNHYTVDMGPRGRQALETLFEKAHQRGLIPAVPPLDLI